LVLDISTSVVSRAKVEAALKSKELIPKGWALDSEGCFTTDPQKALEASRFLPLGSDPDGAAHKGYGLGLVVDILCGVLSGGHFGQELSGAEGDQPAVAKIGHVLGAIKIGAYGPWVQFRNRIDILLHKLTKPSGSKDTPRVVYPGEPEFEMEHERRATGIPIPPDVSARLQRIASGFELNEAWEHLLEGRK
jgi:LDH2 family malate/lactate/ureidoglycolate dehydrogenase